MIDHGIGEEYVAFWLDQDDTEFRDRIDRGMNVGRLVVQTGVRHRSLNQIYDSAFAYTRSPTLAAECLRRALQELANPTRIEVDDSLPPPNSPVWVTIYWNVLESAWQAALKQTNAHPQSGPH